MLAAKDITTVEYANVSNQVGDDELGIGMATYLSLEENEDDAAGTQFKRNFFTVISLFYNKHGQNP